MTALTWDTIGQRYYETGVNKTVLYDAENKGIAWNGVISIDNTNSDSVEPVYFDGVKFNDLLTIGDFAAKLTAFTYPDEFLPFDGVVEDTQGFFITGQSRETFGLSYQTRIANDLDGIDLGYKIHIVYNLTAIPSNRTFKTLSLEPEPLEFEWDLSGIPESVSGYQPTAHVVLDSRKVDPYLLADVENILYGSETTESHLPSLKELSIFISKWGRFVITDFGDGTWSAYTPFEGIITMLDEETFEIDIDSAVYLDPDTYTISSSDLVEEA